MSGKYPPNARDAARAVRATRQPWAEAVASGFEHLSSSMDTVVRALQQSGSVEDFVVTDEGTGRVLAALGEYEKSGIVYSGVYGAEAYLGDPYGTSDPANAILRVLPDGSVTVGQSGWFDVLDPFSESAAWIGTQADRLAVTGAVNNGSGLIRLTVTAHTLATGDSVRVWEVGGVPNATGVFTVTVINANTIDLQNSVFVGTYTSGGFVNRLLHVTGAANNGSGLIRLTIAAHGYESGDKVYVNSVGGVPNATGQWIITVITANTFDLVGSTWGGAYTSGGICLRYFAGGLFQTIAIGDSFADYKLRAFANGALRIRNAEITLTSTSGTTTKTIVIDPDPVGITVQSVDTVTGGLRTEIRDGWIAFNSLDTTGAQDFVISGYMQAGYYSSASVTTSVASSRMIELFGFSGATQYGPLVALWQARGSLLSSTATQSGDTLGGVVAYGYDGAAETNYAAGVRAVATQNHAGGAHGAKLVFETTADGQTTSVGAVIIDENGQIFCDMGATPDDSQIVLKANGAGALSLLTYAADNVQIDFDAEREGGGKVARSTEVAGIAKTGTQLLFRRASGLSIGDPVSYTDVGGFDLSTGNWGFGGNTTPSYAVDATGDVNASGLLRIAGTQVVGARMAAITAPSGGATIDTQARAAIVSIINTLSAGAGGHGLTA